MIVAVVGMTGAGKTTFARMLQESGFPYVRLGQLTMDELARRGLEVSEANERLVREELRSRHGMAAFAELNMEKIRGMGKNVVVDGLYSWEEYLYFERELGRNFAAVAVHASPGTRYSRLSERKARQNDPERQYRPLTPKDARKRDESEIMNLNKAGPIAMAHYVVVNEGSLSGLRSAATRLAESCFSR